MVILIPSTCYSQSAVDRSTISVDRDLRDEAAKQMETAPKPIAVPKEEEKPDIHKGPKVFVKKIKLTGTESFPPEDFQPIIKDYENRKVTRGELDVLAKSIQREYLRRGIIAACFIPPQEVKDNTVIMRVVEAKMGKLIIKDHSFFDDDMLKSYWTTEPGQILRYDKMSHDLQIMNINPDRDLTATLHAGEKPQTTDVTLDVKTRFPVHLTMSFDTEGVKETGKQRKGIGFRDNNFLFVDDMLIGGYIYGTYFSNVYFFHRVPLTNFGTTAMYGYSYSKAAPRLDQSPLGLNSQSRNTSVFLYQDLFVKDEYIGNAYVGLDFKDKTVKWNNGTLHRDRFRILRFGSKLKCTAWGGVSYFTPELSQGINAFGSRRKDILSSRRPGVNDGVENTFTIFKMGFLHRHPLPFDLQGVLNFNSQISSEKLASQEEFFLGGIDSVRGYPAGDFLADDAFQVNCELLIPAFILPEELKLPYGVRPLKDEITGVLFYDYAHGERKGVLDAQVRAGEIRIVDYSSIGVGLRARLMDQVYLRLEWGYPIGANRAISESAPSRLHFSINFEDRLPETIARIKKDMDERNIRKKAWDLVNKEARKKDSPLAKYIHQNLHAAKTAYKRGDLEESKRYYENILVTNTSLYRQAESYVRYCKERQKDLKRLSTKAARCHSRGNLDEAKSLWKEIEQKSKIDPLVLNY